MWALRETSRRTQRPSERRRERRAGPIPSIWGRLVSPISRERQPKPDPTPPETRFESTSGGSDGIALHQGGGRLRRGLGKVRKDLAGRFYQLLSGHAATAPHLMRVGQAPSDKCWWCGKRPETDTPSPFYPVQTAVPRDPKVVAES